MPAGSWNDGQNAGKTIYVGTQNYHASNLSCPGPHPQCGSAQVSLKPQSSKAGFAKHTNNLSYVSSAFVVMKAAANDPAAARLPSSRFTEQRMARPPPCLKAPLIGTQSSR